jgi:hypothetical protein
MNCCDAYGQCIQGEGCPVRTTPVARTVDKVSLRHNVELATPGQWSHVFSRVHLPRNEGGFDIRNSPNDMANARYIASVSPAVVLALLDEIEELKRKLNEQSKHNRRR